MEKILLNITKMLTERKVLLAKNLDKNYNELLKQKTDERIYNIKSDTSDDIYYIMVIYGKLTTIKRIQGLDVFLANSKGYNRIFIGDSINQKAYKQFLELKKAEVFFETDLLINIVEHELQPKFELLLDDEKNKYMEEYDLNIKNMSRILLTDPICRYYAAKSGDIFRIIRPSHMTAMGFHYRLVVDAPVSLLYA